MTLRRKKVKTYRTILIHTPADSATDIHKTIDNFATKDLTCEPSNILHSMHPQMTSFFFSPQNDLPKSSLSFAYERKRVPYHKRIELKVSAEDNLHRSHLVNIVPAPPIRSLSMDTYNELAAEAGRRMRQYLSDESSDINLTITSPFASLRRIISGARSRKLFELWAELYPDSPHPADVERYDKFLCGAFRSRCDIDWELLESYMNTVLDLDPSWSSRMIERGQTAFDLFNVYQYNSYQSGLRKSLYIHTT